ncbi:unnamed protein product [Orchesella dallaii]|uniref:Cyclin-H n=2 Tax=Orchesella dallaii TaxID=48710 RepID=A0ABP1PZI4_9HEXA
MFATSTQKSHWIFSDEETLIKIREDTNKFYVDRFRPPDVEDIGDFFLTATEERSLLHFYEYQLKDFCMKFQPPMSKAVIGTAFSYFKRFFLYNSVMDYHPKEILVTCVYLACKIEEFNVTIAQFVANVRGDRVKAQEIILNNELLLMSAVKFHLTVHNPYRPVEGFLIDLKTRHPILEAENLRPYIDEFLDKVLMTDVPLMYAPAQIALASVLEAARKCREHLDVYVTSILITDEEMLQSVVDAIRTIRLMVRVKNYEPPSRDTVKALEKKLEKCRNQENNPDSTIYKTRMMEELLEEDERTQQDYSTTLAEQRMHFARLIMESKH